MPVPKFDELDRLRKARESIRLDQAELAEKLGVARNTVGRWETGKTPVTKMVFSAYALATGVPIEWLITGIDTTSDRGPDDLAMVAGDVQRARRDSNPQPSDPGTVSVHSRPKVVSLDARRDAKLLAASAALVVAAVGA